MENKRLWDVHVGTICVSKNDNRNVQQDDEEQISNVQKIVDFLLQPEYEELHNSPRICEIIPDCEIISREKTYVPLEEDWLRTEGYKAKSSCSREK
ncbi:unnamed protein product [Caenorhabditis nigoni]